MIHMPRPSQYSRGRHGTHKAAPQHPGQHVHAMEVACWGQNPWTAKARTTQQQGSQQLDCPQHLQEERRPQA